MSRSNRTIVLTLFWFGNFHLQIPSDRTMSLCSTQPLKEMSTRSISWGWSGQCVKLTTYHHPVPLSRNLETLTSWNTLGQSRLVMGLLYHRTKGNIALALVLWEKNLFIFFWWPTKRILYSATQTCLKTSVSLISNFRRVLNVVCFLLGNSPASEFYVLTFRNTPSVSSSYAGRYEVYNSPASEFYLPTFRNTVSSS